MGNGRLWSWNEKQLLKRMWEDSTAKEIARKIGRPVGGVKSKASDMGLKKRHIWTTTDCATLRRLYPDVKKAAAEIGAPISTIYNTAWRLGITRKQKGKRQ